MRALIDITPTSEQLTIVSRNRPGIEVIRGAAGSGKTTTALLRLTSLAGMFSARKIREDTPGPTRIQVLTFNTTLRGYIKELARNKVRNFANTVITIETFAKWALTSLGNPALINDDERKMVFKRLGSKIALSSEFLVTEVEYILGRFLPEYREGYLTVRRDGRGASPRVSKQIREALLNDVIVPYTEWKRAQNCVDWFDLEVSMAKEKIHNYDVVIVDETQDFSANQLRAIMNQLADVHAVTFVVDTAQKIYARGFTWHECGISIRPESVYRLRRNYRNTAQIASFAFPLLNGLEVDDDATIPAPSLCSRQGPLPKVLVGRFSGQLSFALEFIRKEVDLTKDSVAFLHPKGGGWFSETKRGLASASLEYAEITRQAEWPVGEENIALSTLHSSKGLEFDHVIIIGASAETLKHGNEADDDNLLQLRRLLAMGISRAKKTVMLGYKPEERSRLIDYLAPSTYNEFAV